MYLSRMQNQRVKPRAINGRSFAHQKLSVRQRAALGAQLVKGEAGLDLSASQAARVAGCSIPYVAAACRWSPEKRAAVVRGLLLPKPKIMPKPKVVPKPLASPAMESGKPWFREMDGKPAIVVRDLLSDAALADMIRDAGVDRILSIACEIEQAAAAAA